MERLICLGIGYVCGLLQSGYLVGKLYRVDIRQAGSGNVGTTNALRVIGWKAGALTFLGDVAKCLIAMGLVRWMYQGSGNLLLLMMYAGLGTTLGHNFPFYLKFQGGKGIAVLAGIVLSMGLVFLPIPFAAFLISVIFTRYVSLGSLLASSMFFLEVVMFGCVGAYSFDIRRCYELYALAGILMCLAWWRHRANIKRMLAGEEHRFGEKK